MEKYNWTTEHLHQIGLMIHSFGNGISVVNNLITGQINSFKNGEVTRSMGAITDIKKYTEFLSSVARDAEKLKKFEA